MNAFKAHNQIDTAFTLKSECAVGVDISTKVSEPTKLKLPVC